ncbi:hypothetical protein HSM_0272 [Histophilus somni 2336]|nr:hypothetical protein HSM_0272 [Histophilus somni 2336]
MRQDTMTYKGKQMNVKGQVTVGYGFSASADFNQSKINADYASVQEQSGIYAGDEGYQINIAQHTDLKGGLITSTAQAEKQGKNQFSTGTLSYSDIQNYSHHSARGFGLSGGVTVSGGEAPKEIGGMNLQHIGQNAQDGSSKVEYSGIAGVSSQGNWGITKGITTALLGQVKYKGSESGITTGSINTAHITIRHRDAQQKLTGKTVEESLQNLPKINLHQGVEKADVETIRSDLARDLNTATEFVNNLNNQGDEIHYKMEKNEDSLFSIQKTRSDCDHISCLDFDKDNSQELKRIIYSEELLTEEQAKLFSKVATAGMLNLTREAKVSSAVLYDKDLSSIEDTALILNRGSAGILNEIIFTGFERFRAWVNMPAIFGASNATRAHAQIAKKLDEYNAYAESRGTKTYTFKNSAHSLGVSGNKNMLNWSEHIGQKYEHTDVEYLHLGGSYPSSEIDQQSRRLFKSVKTQYHGVKGDFVYEGTPVLRNLGLGMIGNNPNATPNKANVSFLDTHTKANQNINNLKFVYKSEENGTKTKEWLTIEDMLKKTYTEGIRKFNEINGGR